MLDKTEYWLGLCDDDMKAAKAMLETKNYLWMGFICHLVAEKAIKAVIASVTSELPPKIHDLKTLAKRGNITDDLSEFQIDLLERLNPLQIEARYPEYKEKIAATLNQSNCAKLLSETEEFVCWIKQKLDKLPGDTQK